MCACLTPTEAQATKQFRDDDSISVKEDPNLHGEGYWLHIADVTIMKGPLAKWAFPHGISNERDLLVVPQGSVYHDFSVH